MDCTWASEIDTACAGCGSDAVDWVQADDGTRRYACEDCLQPLLRTTEADALDALPATPDAVRCQHCQQFTLAAHVDPAKRCAECAEDDGVLTDLQERLE